MNRLLAVFAFAVLLPWPGLAQAGAVEAGTRPWPGAAVQVWIDPAVRANRDRNGKVLRAIAAWRSATGVRIEVTTSRRGPTLFVVDGGRGPCTANVGYYPRVPAQGPGASGGVLTVGQCSAGSVLHEFGHVLGLMHEHQRADRDRYLSFSPVAAVLAACGRNPGPGCAEALANVGRPRRLQLQSDYDPCSLMHYLADQSAKARRGRFPRSPGWNRFYMLTAAGEANYRLCRSRLAPTPDCASGKTGQKCQITCQDANTVAVFHGLKPRRACWGGPIRRSQQIAR